MAGAFIDVELTDEARKLAWQAYGPLGEMGAPIVGKLSDEELATVIEFLRGGTEINERRAEQILPAPRGRED